MKKKIAFIGAGHITHILLASMMKTGAIQSSQIIVSNPSTEKLKKLKTLFNVNVTTDNKLAMKFADWIFINVRPEIVRIVIEELKMIQLKNKLIISVAAGIPLSIFEAVGKDLPVIRMIPNPPVQFGKGIVAVTFNRYVTEKSKEEIESLFNSLGIFIELDERLMNIFSAISSPVFTYYICEILITAGIKNGINRDEISFIVYHTIRGSLEAWRQRNLRPGKLIEEASTPGGISEATIKFLIRKDIKTIIFEAIEMGKSVADTISKK